MIDKGRVRGLIFDYGGTLDTGGDHWSVVIGKAYRKAGVVVEESAFRSAYVYAERELAKSRYILPEHNFLDLMRIKMHLEFGWLVEHGYLTEEVAALKSEEVASLCYESAKSKVGEAKPVLDELGLYYPMVLVSNFYGNVESVLEDFGLIRCFPKIIESAVVGVRKPDPVIFELGVKALGITPGEAVVIGDSYGKDIVPAQKIGCQTIWIKGKGWTGVEDAQTHPDIIKSLKDLPPLLIPANGIIN